MPVDLRLLGGLTVTQAGTEERAPLEMPVTLLVYLALKGAWVERRELALLYRPDAPEAEALGYLRKLVYRARRYDWAAGLEVEQDALRWLVGTDVARFERAVEAKAWADAVGEYEGPLLGGALLNAAPGFSVWYEAEAAALGAAWLRAANGLARAHEEAGRYEEASLIHRRVLAHDPFAEVSVQALLRLLGSLGQRREALELYDEFSRALHSELGAAPLETTEALADVLRSSAGEGALNVAGAGAAQPVTLEASVAPPATQRAPGRPPTQAARLPSPGTPFVGRRGELKRLAHLFGDEGARLVTIVGLGGSGKTRLAVEAAQAAATAGQRVAFVSLASTASHAAAAAAVVEALGLPWVSEDAERALTVGLQDADLLLVLDNFEGVIDAAPLVGRLLSAAPSLSVMVTSREPLKLNGEWLLDLSGLETPPAGTVNDLATFDAVRLFLQQAKRLLPTLTPDAATLEDVAEICRKVEGLPLAIEFAASWSPLLTIPEILLEVQRDPRILASERRDVPARHRSLWRIFDHTWERLTEAERSALLALVVFPEDFALPAAREVTQADVSTVLRLMDLKLVRRTGEGRFALHQLVRQYAQQRSAAGELLGRARAAHSNHYAGLLERLTPNLKGNDVPGGLAAVQAELANVLAAWNHAVSRTDLTALDRARDALDDYFYYRADFATGCKLFSQAAEAVERAAGEEPSPQRTRVAGRLLVHLSQLEGYRGRFPTASRIAERALARLREAGTKADVAYAELALGSSLMKTGSYSEGEQLMRSVLEHALESGDLYLQGAAHNGLANFVSFTQGNMAVAEEHYRASLRANRQLGNLEGINGALINLGACRYDVGDLSGATRLWQEAVDIAVELGYRQREAVLHNNIGSLLETQGHLDEAERRYLQSLRLRREIDDVSGQANVLHNLGRLAAERGKLPEAEDRFEEALGLFQAGGDRAGTAHVKSSLSRLLAAQGRDADALQQARDALSLALAIDSRSDILSSLLSLAMLHERAGEAALAAELAQTVSAAAAGSAEPLRQAADHLLRRVRGGGGDERGTELPMGAAPDREIPNEELILVARRELERLQPARSWNGQGTAAL